LNGKKNRVTTPPQITRVTDGFSYTDEKTVLDRDLTRVFFFLANKWYLASPLEFL
jgi:hypothetical protein